MTKVQCEENRCKFNKSLRCTQSIVHLWGTLDSINPHCITMRKKKGAEP